MIRRLVTTGAIAIGWGPGEQERAEYAALLAWSGVTAALIAVSGTVTIRWCAAMGGMGSMPMPGHWLMSMMWMRMPGQTWLQAAAVFLGMWTVMMVAMMLPSFVPMAWRYRQAVRGSCAPRTRLALLSLMSAGYLLVWAVLGLLAFVAGVAFMDCAMGHPALSQAVPVLAGLAVMGAGALQFSAWKARQLACCRAAPSRARVLPAELRSAWRHGLRLGVQCSSCCAGSTMVLLAIGVMDVRMMVVVTMVITAERLAPAGQRVAQALGALMVAAGIVMLLRLVCG